MTQRPTAGPTTAELITSFAPIVLQLVEQFRHRHDQVTDEEVQAALQAAIAKERMKGVAWAQAHPDA